jgi:hypothetical protein
MALLASGSASAGPAAARYSADSSRVFWFLVTADTHIGGGFTGGADTERLQWVTGEAVDVINPVSMFVCGDLVDGSGPGGIPLPWTGQVEEEWTEYRQLLDLAGMTPGFYVDLPGNHDQYGDKGLTFYRKHSIQGSSDDQTQHSTAYETAWGTYHFLSVSTAGNDGAPWPADNAGIDDAELAFAKQALEAHADASLQFAFGHHSLGYPGMPGSGIDGQSAFRALLAANGVVAYFYGHTHAYAVEFHDGVLQFNLNTLGKADDDHVAVAVVDNDSLAVRAFRQSDWPYVVVSAPADADLGGGNPYAYAVPPGWTTAPVRAAVFSKTPPAAVEASVDDGPWFPMTPAAQSLWAATMDTTGLAPGKHFLAVRAQPWPDRDHRIAFLVAETTCSNGKDDDGDGLTDWPDDPGCENPADMDEVDPPPVEPNPEEGGDEAAAGSDEAAPDGPPDPEPAQSDSDDDAATDVWAEWIPDVASDSPIPDTSAPDMASDPSVDAGDATLPPDAPVPNADAQSDAAHEADASDTGTDALPEAVEPAPDAPGGGCGCRQGVGSAGTDDPLSGILGLALLLALSRALRRRPQGE